MVAVNARRLGAVAILASLVACSNRPSVATLGGGSRTTTEVTVDIAPPATVAPTIITDRTEYRATVDMMFTRITVPFRYTNPGPDTTIILFCQTPRPPVLQRWTGSDWTVVYNAYIPSCAAPPVVVAPGASFADTLRVMGGRPGTSHRPVFDSRFAHGHYRLLGMLGPREGTLPFERRVSNVFRVVQ